MKPPVLVPVDWTFMYMVTSCPTLAPAWAVVRMSSACASAGASASSRIDKERRRQIITGTLASKPAYGFVYRPAAASREAKARWARNQFQPVEIAEGGDQVSRVGAAWQHHLEVPRE